VREKVGAAPRHLRVNLTRSFQILSELRSTLRTSLQTKRPCSPRLFRSHDHHHHHHIHNHHCHQHHHDHHSSTSRLKKSTVKREPGTRWPTGTAAACVLHAAAAPCGQLMNTFAYLKRGSQRACSSARQARLDTRPCRRCLLRQALAERS
jgi:hypothetical protein